MRVLEEHESMKQDHEFMLDKSVQLPKPPIIQESYLDEGSIFVQPNSSMTSTPSKNNQMINHREQISQ